MKCYSEYQKDMRDNNDQLLKHNAHIYDES